MIRNWLEVY